MEGKLLKGFKPIKLISRIVLIILLICSASAYAEYGGPIKNSRIDPTIIRVDEEKYLGSRIDGDYVLIDRKEREFKLGDMFGKPVILVLSYYTCEGACSTANIRLKESISAIVGKKISKDYRVITISFDKRDNLNTLRAFYERLELPAEMKSDWGTFLMKNKDDIERLTSSIGFKFFWSPADSMFLHPNVYVFISPDGRIVRYLYGGAMDGRDVELALAETAIGKVARSKVEDMIDIFLIACYSYNFKEGKYTLNYPVFIAMGSLLFGVSMIAISIIIVRKKVRRQNYD